MSFSDAKRKVLIADHMLVMTYKQLKDPKLLVAVLDNLYNSIKLSLTTLLIKERKYKRIPAYQENIEGMLKVFREKVLQKTKMKESEFRDIVEIVELYKNHKESDMEFQRKKQYVIASKDYKLKTLSEDKLKKFVQTAKSAIQTMESYHDRSI